MNSRFYRRYPGEHAKDTAHLSLAQQGAYSLLMDYCFSRGESFLLPHSIEAVYRICRAITAEDQAAVRDVVEEFFWDGSHHLNRKGRAGVNSNAAKPRQRPKLTLIQKGQRKEP